MNILITGGAGFIGSRLALSLEKRGHKVRVLDNLSPQIHGTSPENSELFQSILEKVDFRLGDVRFRDDWLKSLEGQDVVVHLAAETGTGQSMYEIDRYVDVNLRGTGLLLEVLTKRERTVKKIVVASSRAIYGEGKYYSDEAGFFYPGPRAAEDMARGIFEIQCPLSGKQARFVATDEESVLSPSSIYGITKQTQEQMVLTIARSLNISGIAFRYQNVYGPGQSLVNPYTGILSIFSNLLRQNKDVNIFEDGKESRDFVYIDDVVDATIRGIEYDDFVCNAFNVGSGVSTDVLTVARTLKEKYQSTGTLSVTGNFRIGDIRHNYADISKIQAIFGFNPEISFREGIDRFVSWVNSKDIVVEHGYNKSLNELRDKGLLK